MTSSSIFNLFIGIALLLLVGFKIASNDFYIWFDLIVGGANLFLAGLNLEKK
jgi:hypothetical protein